MKIINKPIRCGRTIKANVFIVAIISFTLIQTGHVKAQTNKVVIGYVGGFTGLVNTDIIDAEKVTHINYAFVDIKNNRAWLHREAIDTVNFRRLISLKKKNPSLKLLISIGGWAWSSKFSDAVLTDTARAGFCRKRSSDHQKI